MKLQKTLQCLLLFFCGTLVAAKHPLYDLMIYGKKENIPTIKGLVNQNYKILDQRETDVERYKGLTPIFFISQTNRSFLEELFKQVPQFKKYINDAPAGFTPLIYFVNGRHNELAFLIEQGGDVKAIQSGEDDFRKGTLLHKAIMLYFRDFSRVVKVSNEEKKNKQLGKLNELFLPTIRMLIEHGIDPTQKIEKIEVENILTETLEKYDNISSRELAEKLGLHEAVELIDSLTGKSKDTENAVDKFGAALSSIK